MDDMERKIQKREAARIRAKRDTAAQLRKLEEKERAAGVARVNSELRIKIPRLLKRLEELDAPDAITFDMKIWGGLLFKKRFAKRAGWFLFSHSSSGGYSHQGIQSTSTENFYLLTTGEIMSGDGKPPYAVGAALAAVDEMIEKYGA